MVLRKRDGTLLSSAVNESPSMINPPGGDAERTDNDDDGGDGRSSRCEYTRGRESGSDHQRNQQSQRCKCRNRGRGGGGKRTSFIVVFMIIAALNLRLMLSCLIHLKDFLHIDPSTTFNATQRDAATAESELKHILLYTKYWGEDGFQFGTNGQEPFLRYGCPVDACSVTHERSLLGATGDFDAVLFSGVSSDWNEQRDDTSQWRQPHQRFVLFAMESPIHFGLDWPKYNGFFNWTMTYRTDSDFPRPYGWIGAKKGSIIEGDPRHNGIGGSSTPESPNWIPYDAGQFIQQVLPTKPQSFRDLAWRPKMVAWIVGNCRPTASMRNEYVQELSKHIPVDIFGSAKRCIAQTPIPCDKSYSVHNHGVDNCTQTVMRDYKFYLSFENSLCIDYVTEKFFGRMQQSILPVVLGAANYSAIAPPHSHLNVLDFASPKALADHLWYLHDHPEEYLSYFWWKDHYDAVAPWTTTDMGVDRQQHISQTPPASQQEGRNNFGHAMCSLCSRLHGPAQQRKTYEDLMDWWQTQSQCGKGLRKLQSRLMQGRGPFR